MCRNSFESLMATHPIDHFCSRCTLSSLMKILRLNILVDIKQLKLIKLNCCIFRLAPLFYLCKFLVRDRICLSSLKMLFKMLMTCQISFDNLDILFILFGLFLFLLVAFFDLISRFVLIIENVEKSLSFF